MLRAALLYTLMPLVSALLIAFAAVGWVLSLGLLRWPINRIVCRVFGHAALALAGVRVEISGAEHLVETRPRVMIQNHGSMLDFLVAGRLAPPRILVVVKKSVRWLFPVNIGLLLLGSIFVGRDGRGRSHSKLQRVSEQVSRGRRSIVFSPEGTRSRSGELQTFRSGAFRVAQLSRAEIVPVVIFGAHALCPPTGWRIRPGCIRVEIKPPIAAPDPESDPSEVAAEVQQMYRAWLAESKGV
jgi:1-acyl-sn-glycerol-3-phosphate acyltransferase